MQQSSEMAMTETCELTLHVRDHFAPELLDVPASELWQHLPGPTLFHIPGRIEQPLFATVLLHGNEETGWQAVQTVLREHQDKPLPRALLLFVGNIEAAKAGVRTLPSQNDYNRTWPGTPLASTPEARLMLEVTNFAKRHTPIASIDIHNNTGLNPHYACVNRLADSYLHLARLFSRTVVFFERPLGVQSASMLDVCPAVTVECGRIGTGDGISHAAEFIKAALSLSHFPEHPVPEGDIDVMQTFAILRVPAEASLSFNGADADFRFRPDLDSLNFAELEPGTSFGTLGGTANRMLEILPGLPHGDGDHLHDPLFAYDAGEIRLQRRVIPSMLTLDTQAIRLDCLGYLMHRIGRDGTPIES